MSDLRPATMDDALEKLTIAILRPMMKVLSAPEPEPLRKAALVEAVRLRLTEEVFRSLWERLDDIQQLAVSETLYSPEHRLDHRRFYAKYDALPEGIDWSNSTPPGRRITRVRWSVPSGPSPGAGWFKPPSLPN